MRTASVDIDLSAEREHTMDDEDGDEGVGDDDGGGSAQAVVITGIQLGTLEWITLAVRLWLATIAATALVSPLLLALGLGLYALARWSFVALFG